MPACPHCKSVNRAPIAGGGRCRHKLYSGLTNRCDSSIGFMLLTSALQSHNNHENRLIKERNGHDPNISNERLSEELHEPKFNIHFFYLPLVMSLAATLSKT